MWSEMNPIGMITAPEAPADERAARWSEMSGFQPGDVWGPERDWYTRSQRKSRPII